MTMKEEWKCSSTEKPNRSTASAVAAHRPTPKRLCATKAVRSGGYWDVADNPVRCRTIRIDCSHAGLLSSKMLGRLISLQRRLKRRKTRLVLSGLPVEVREIINWVKLDRLFEIEQDASRSSECR